MIIDRIRGWARSQPNARAVVHDGASASYAEFARDIDAASAFFAPFDLPVGRTAILMVDDLYDAWVLLLALRGLGLTTVSVTSLAQAEQLAIADVACVVITEAERARHDLTGRALVGVQALIVPRLARGEPPEPTETRPLGGHILYTSGTTGTYKTLLEAGRIESRRNQARADLHGLDTSVVHQAINLGQWTAAGFKTPPSIWHVGGCVVFDQREDRYARFLDGGVNRAFCLPSMLNDVLAARAPEAGPDEAVEIVVSGGFLPLGTASAIARRLTPRIKLTYGSTELGTFAMSSRFTGADDLHWMSPSPGRVIEIVDEDGAPRPVGEEGELRIARTDIDASAYLDDPETSARVFRGGYFYPGDMAVRRADGRIRVLGRTADVLNVHGQKVAAAPIEQEIQRRLGVDEVCLFGGLRPDGREEVVIAIQSDPAPPQSALDAIAGDFVRFENVRFAVLPAFPRTESTGKTRRLVLRRMVIKDG